MRRIAKLSVIFRVIYMLDNFFLCLNGIAPIFLLVVLGSVLKRFGIFDDNFASKANNLVFKVSLPSMLFYDITTCDIAKQFDGKLVAVAVISVILMFFASMALAMVITKDNKKRAAFAQGVFRSNYAILGVPLTKALFDADIAVNASVILAICVPIFNVLAVVALSFFLESHGGIKRVLRGVVTNPIIIGAVLGGATSLLGVHVPGLVLKAVNYLGEMCVPLALLIIGASMKMENVKSTLSLSVVAAAIKVIVTPLIFTIPALALGISGAKFGVLFVYFAAPSAVSGYIMIRNMGGDYNLSGNIILISTALSFFVIFAGMMIMKTVGMF